MDMVYNNRNRSKKGGLQFLAVCLIVALCPSCLKIHSPSSLTWQDKGDFYSHEEGFHWKGEEYHERLFIVRNGMMHRNLLVAISDSVVALHYNSYRLASKPKRDGTTVDLDIHLLVDSLLYSDSIKYPVGDNASSSDEYSLVKDCEINFVCGTDYYKVMDGWVSFKYGNKYTEYYQNEQKVSVYQPLVVLFEFRIMSADGEESFVTDGYIYGNDGDR